MAFAPSTEADRAQWLAYLLSRAWAGLWDSPEHWRAYLALMGRP